MDETIILITYVPLLSAIDGGSFTFILWKSSIRSCKLSYRLTKVSEDTVVLVRLVLGEVLCGEDTTGLRHSQHDIRGQVTRVQRCRNVSGVSGQWSADKLVLCKHEAYYFLTSKFQPEIKMSNILLGTDYFVNPAHHYINRSSVHSPARYQ